MSFSGAKVALLHAGEVLSYERDLVPGLPNAGCRDLPGGFREGEETAAACAAREVREETGLILHERDFHWGREIAGDPDHPRPIYIFAAHITQAQIETLSFGEEGGDWRFMPVADFVAHPKTIPWVRRLVEAYLREQP